MIAEPAIEARERSEGTDPALRWDREWGETVWGALRWSGRALLAFGLALALLRLLLGAPLAHATPDGYTYCAAENEVCTVTVATTIIYGADSTTDPAAVTGMYTTPASTDTLGGLSFTCNPSTPGLYDPAPGLHKACWYQSAGATSGGGTTGQTITLVFPDWLSLSAEDGMTLSAAIAAVWATAWASRALIATLRGSDAGDADD